MSNHPNRAHSHDLGQGWRIIRLSGVTMTDGFQDDLGPRKMFVAADPAGALWPVAFDRPPQSVNTLKIDVEGGFYRLYDLHRADYIGGISRPDGPLSIGSDGRVSHGGATTAFYADTASVRRINPA